MAHCVTEELNPFVCCFVVIANKATVKKRTPEVSSGAVQGVGLGTGLGLRCRLDLGIQCGLGYEFGSLSDHELGLIFLWQLEYWC